jgi:hypothetical protein
MFLKPKKGQGISMNVIIIAAIALIVLVILVMIFTGRLRTFGGTITSCASKDGECYGPLNELCFDMSDSNNPVYKGGTGCGCPSGSVLSTGTDCEKTRRLCCTSII